MNQDKSEPEAYRLTLALGIVASWLAYLAVRTNFQKWLPKPFEQILLIGISASGVLSFLFLIATASLLKYNHLGHMGNLAFSTRNRRTLYDLSIDILGVIPEYVLLVWFLTYANHHYAHKPVELSVALVIYLFMGVVTVKFLWALTMFALSQLYKENRIKPPKLAVETFVLIIAFLGSLNTLRLASRVRHNPWHLIIYWLGIFLFGLGLSTFSPYTRTSSRLFGGFVRTTKRLALKVPSFTNRK